MLVFLVNMFACIWWAIVPALLNASASYPSINACVTSKIPKASFALSLNQYSSNTSIPAIHLSNNEGLVFWCNGSGIQVQRISFLVGFGSNWWLCCKAFEQTLEENCICCLHLHSCIRYVSPPATLLYTLSFALYILMNICSLDIGKRPRSVCLCLISICCFYKWMAHFMGVANCKKKDHPHLLAFVTESCIMKISW